MYVKGTVVAVCLFFSSVSSTQGSAKELKYLLMEKEFRGLKETDIRSDGDVHLAFISATRDKVAKSVVTLRFEILTSMGKQLGGYDPSLELELGMSGRRLVTQNYTSEWKAVKFGTLRNEVTLVLKNVAPTNDKIEKLTVNLYCKQLGKGRAEMKKTFSFASLPVSR